MSLFTTVTRAFRGAGTGQSSSRFRGITLISESRSCRSSNSFLLLSNNTSVPSARNRLLRKDYSVHTPRKRMAQSSDELRNPNAPLLPGQALRIYSMRMCPYAQRARLILAAKGVDHDLVNIDLNNKPDWFFDLNPYGEVPVVLHKGGCVYESLITAEYLEEAFPEPKLYADDPLTRAKEKIYFNHWTKKGIPAFYSLLKAGHADPDDTQRLESHIKVMDNFLKELKKPYFHGDKIGFSDYMIWPWFERMKVLHDISDFSISREKYPYISDWIDRMWKDEVVQKCKIDLDLMTLHYSHYRTGRPDFTIGAEKGTRVTEALENLDGLRDPSTRDRHAKK